MSIKAIIGIILVILGIGSGVLEWLRTGFATPYPALGLIMTAVGTYLVIDGLRRRAKPSLPRGDVTMAALLLGVIGGTVALAKLKERASSVSREEVEEALKQLELLRLQGRITPERYRELKAILESARR